MKLELRGITKRFGTLVANDHIDLVVEPGEIHCPPRRERRRQVDADERPLRPLPARTTARSCSTTSSSNFQGPGDAMRAGIGMVHQHFMLIPVFTVAENVMLGHEPTKAGGVLDLADGARSRCARSRAPLRLPRRPRRARRGPSRRRAAARRDHQGALARRRGAHPRRADRRAHAAGDRRADGDHAPAQGRRAPRSSSSPTSCARCARSPTASPSSASGRSSARPRRRPTNAELASLMVGRAVELTVHKDAAEARRRRARRRGTSASSTPTASRRRRRQLRRARRRDRSRSPACRATARPSSTEASSASQHRVQRLDHARRRGARRHERPRASSTRASASCPRTAPRTGWSASSRSPRTSCSTAPTVRPSCAAGTPPLGVLAEFAEREVHGVRRPRPRASRRRVGTLSGGNQQKVVLAREMSRELQLLVAAQPTRGVDVGSIEFIHKRIVETRDAGIPVIVVSTELDEVTALADRIIVMYRGRIVGHRARRHPARRARPDDGRRGPTERGSPRERAADPAGRTDDRHPEQ